MSENTSDKNVPQLRTRKFINFRVVPLKIFPVLSNHLTTVYIYYSSCDLTTRLHIHELKKSFSIRQRSTDGQIRGPTGPNRSEIFKILFVLVRSEIWKFLVLVRVDPGFLKFSQSWSELVRKLLIFFCSVRDQSVLVRRSLMSVAIFV